MLGASGRKSRLAVDSHDDERSWSAGSNPESQTRAQTPV
jgi:hypothetical protein